MRRPARERMGSVQVDTPPFVCCEIQAAKVLQDGSIAVAGGELAEATGAVVDPEVETVVEAGFGVIVD